MRKVKRHVAKLMVTVMISTLLSSFFSSVAYANEITDLIPGTVTPIEGVVDVAGGENETEEASYETPVAEESIQEETADADDVSEAAAAEHTEDQIIEETSDEGTDA
jgi:PDZ domain-containing secreted protein